MSTQPIKVKIIESTSDFVTVKLPFLDVPVQMNHEMFNQRRESGYFNVENEIRRIPRFAS